MRKDNASPSLFEQALSDGKSEKTLLRLFVAGFSPRSQYTIETLLQLCNERLAGRYLLEIVDIYQKPELARQQQIVATPTLVKYLPTPKKVWIGDLSKTDRVLAGLGVPE